MTDRIPEDGSAPLALPHAPNLDWLRKQAKRRLAELRETNPPAKLAEAQFDLAKRYGFPSWRALKAHVESLTIDGQLFAAARSGDLAMIERIVAEFPEKLRAEAPPYGMTLLHAAAHHGRLDVVDYLLARGLDPNAREKGDNTYPIHWAAAGGHLDVVKRLADAGGDVVGHGDDHALEVIGWASCWEGTEDDAHRAVVRFLLSRGARHHIFSAIGVNSADAVREVVARDPSALSAKLSHNESGQRPLHFAVRMKRTEMIPVLLDLGADPAQTDDAGFTASVYATTPDVDRAILERLRDRTDVTGFCAAVGLGDWSRAAHLLRAEPSFVQSSVLHLMAKRGNAAAVDWLLAHGATPNGRWDHWGALVTPLHLANFGGNVQVVQTLLAAGADLSIKDSMHDGTPLGWAEHFGRVEIVRAIREWQAPSASAPHFVRRAKPAD